MLFTSSFQQYVWPKHPFGRDYLVQSENRKMEQPQNSRALHFYGTTPSFRGVPLLQFMQKEGNGRKTGEELKEIRIEKWL